MVFPVICINMNNSEKQKRYLERLRNDPIRYSKYLERRRRLKKRYREKLRNDPIRYSEYLKEQKQRRILNGQTTFRRSSVSRDSEYWKRERGYERYYKHCPFRKMARGAGVRCKKNKITAFQLWCLAKKQKLICPLTKERLTIENISLDHKIPISKDGTNDISNLQLVTRQSNVIKNNMTMEEFYLFCKNVVNNISTTLPIVGSSTPP